MEEVFTPQEILEACLRLEDIYARRLLEAIIAGRADLVLQYDLRLAWVQDTIVYIEDRI